jgi:type I site-specific restriction endonuclease
MPLSEADTSRKFIIPKLQASGWDDDPHSIAEQRSITDGRIVPVGKGFVRKPPKRADYLLRDPNREQLMRLGLHIQDRMPEQEMIDTILGEGCEKP